MKAALVEGPGAPPKYGDFADPTPAAGQVLIKVSAAALSPLVRGQASGQHYSSETKFPFIPGFDGVGRRPDGTRVYFAFPNRPFGAMAEQTIVRSETCVPLPDELDDVTAAGIGNPGMSSWVALTRRARFQHGETVLINGATGSAGRLAIQISKHLGAKRVLVTGRGEKSLVGTDQLGADVRISLDQPREKLVETLRNEMASNGVNVILDYLWGAPAESLLAAIAGHATGEAAPRIRYVQIGSIAGATIPFPAAVLRSSGLELLGSGLGSSSNKELVQSIGEMMKAVVPGKFKVNTEPVPLADVETAWKKETDARIVFTI